MLDKLKSVGQWFALTVCIGMTFILLAATCANAQTGRQYGLLDVQATSWLGTTEATLGDVTGSLAASIIFGPVMVLPDGTIALPCWWTGIITWENGAEFTSWSAVCAAKSNPVELGSLRIDVRFISHNHLADGTVENRWADDKWFFNAARRQLRIDSIVVDMELFEGRLGQGSAEPGWRESQSLGSDPPKNTFE